MIPSVHALRSRCPPPLTFPDILYAVVGERLVVPEGLTSHYRRWSIANGIGHWAIHRKINEFRQPSTPLKMAVMRFQASAFAFHLLVDVDQADYWRLTEPVDISRAYGIPVAIVQAYQGDWLLPFHVTPPDGRLYGPEELGVDPAEPKPTREMG